MGLLINSYAVNAGPVITSVEYTDTFNDGTSAATQTFTGEAIGTAHANREVVVMFGWNNNVSLSSATIGGVAATIHQQGLLSSFGMAVIQASVPTGTTADIVLNFSGAAQYLAGAVYKVVTSTPTPLDSAINSDTGTTVRAGSVAVADDGILIAGGFAAVLGTLSASYTGIDTPIVDADNVWNVDTRRLHTWHCSTTETIGTRDAGISSVGNSARHAIGISFS